MDLKGYVMFSCGNSKHVVEVREPRMGFRVVQTLGKKNGEWGRGVGEFFSPKGMSVDENNTLAVTDYQNCRIQFFS